MQSRSDEKRKNSLVYLFGKTWRYSEENRFTIVKYWSMFLLAMLIDNLFTPLVWAHLMNVVQEEGLTEASFPKLFWILLLTAVGSVMFWMLHGPARVLESTSAFKARINYRRYLMKGVMTMPMDWHVEHHSGDTIDKVNKGTDALFDFSRKSFEIIYSLSELVISFGMLVYLAQSSAYIIIFPTILSVWITIRFDRVLIDQYKELSRSENNVSESVFDAISNIATVIILRVERFVFASLMSKVEKPYDLFKRNSQINELKWFLTSLCTRFMTVSVLGLYFWQQSKVSEGVAIGTVYLLITYLRNVGDTYFRFAGTYGDTVKQKARLLNSEELSKDFKVENFSNHVLPSDWKELSVRDLNFSYHKSDGTDLHLEDISMKIKRGQFIALVGATGSGKTTLLKIMRDLYHPKSLELMADGNLVQQGFEGISRAISLVPQNPELFARSIFENITLGAEYDMEFVRRYTDMACFTEVAESLPRKFDSSVKEKGVNLSGGQSQRLALSRGLLACHDKDIVLLDEPTSSLDVATEMTVYRNIFQGFRGKTIISSIHRLHLLPLFDFVYMFDKGKIIASGTVTELLQSSPEFAELWQKQYVETL